MCTMCALPQCETWEDADVSGLLEQAGDAATAPEYHTFADPAAVVQLRSQLLRWYDKDKRELPWRTLVRDT